MRLNKATDRQAERDLMRMTEIDRIFSLGSSFGSNQNRTESQVGGSLNQQSDQIQGLDFRKDEGG